MNYNFTLEEFEGPLDLLLSLIKKSDIDICDISISDITDQYLAIINDLGNKELDLSSEYLVMAAELIEMKSKLLLPKQTIEEEEEDFREELINRLLVYKDFKEISEKLRLLHEDRNLSKSKEPSDISSFQELIIDEVEETIDINEFADIFSSFLNRCELTKPLHTRVTSKGYSVSKRSEEIRTILKKKNRVEFDELFTIHTKDFVIVTFLSILNLARKKELVIVQDFNFDKIIISNGGI